MKKLKNNLDEMQEQELLKIEHNGCWLVFWLLLIAIVVQSIVFENMEFKTVAGEWVVFMVLALYLGIACARKGIWDRHIPMNTKTNLIISLIASLAVGVFNFVMVFKNFQKPIGALAASVITVVIAFVLCIAALTLTMKKKQKKKQELEAEPSDSNE